MIDVSNIRTLFPILSRKINGEDLVYFDNAATTHKPQSVIDAEKNYYQKNNANIHRGVHFLSQISTSEFEETRDVVQSFINAKSNHEIIFTKGTTESINLIANGFQSILKKGDEVIISEMEHHSNIVPWQICCEISGATLRVVPLLENGNLNMQEFNNFLNDNTKLVAITHISNALGTINPIDEIINLSHNYGAQILIDGAQAVAHHKIDVQELDVDFYCFSGHKMYGPTGVGVLYGKEHLLNNLPPYQSGGEMIKEVRFEKTTYADLPYKFEAGTPPIAEVIGLSASINFINEIGIENIYDYENQLTQYAYDQMKKNNDMKIYGDFKNQTSIISFNLDGAHFNDLAILLDKKNIAIRTGHHCAQPFMKHFKISGNARLSVGIYNSKDDVDYFIKSIDEVKNIITS